MLKYPRVQTCVKQFEHNGFPCLIVKVMVGPEYPYLCGFVGVHKNHSLYKVRLEDLPELSVHGGVVSAEARVQVFGETPEIWWLGFECAYSPDPFAKENDEGFVEAQCTALANQLEEKPSVKGGKLIAMPSHSNALH